METRTKSLSFTVSVSSVSDELLFLSKLELLFRGEEGDIIKDGRYDMGIRCTQAGSAQ